MKDRDTPLPLVRQWEKMVPGVYAQMDHLHQAKADGEIQWPDYCQLPIGAAFTLLQDQEGLSVQQAAAGAAELTACWMWRRSKIVYSFDQDLAQALAEQAEDVEDTDVLPCQLLMHLLYPCIYIKAPNMLEHTDGFFAWIEYDMDRAAPELRIQWLLASMEYSVPQVLHLLPGEPIKACILDTVHTTQENLGDDIKLQDVDVNVARVILSAIQLILYIVSENAEIDPVPLPMVRDKTDGKVTTLRKSLEDKASQVREMSVGVRVGAALRKAKRAASSGKSAGAGGKKRSHTRWGHWHNYWTGPKEGERTLLLKWTAPTIIHPDAGVGDNVVVYPVKQD